MEEFITAALFEQHISYAEVISCGLGNSKCRGQISSVVYIFKLRYSLDAA